MGLKTYGINGKEAILGDWEEICFTVVALNLLDLFKSARKKKYISKLYRRHSFLVYGHT